MDENTIIRHMKIFIYDYIEDVNIFFILFSVFRPKKVCKFRDLRKSFLIYLKFKKILFVKCSLIY